MLFEAQIYDYLWFLIIFTQLGLFGLGLQKLNFFSKLTGPQNLPFVIALGVCFGIFLSIVLAFLPIQSLWFVSVAIYYVTFRGVQHVLKNRMQIKTFFIAHKENVVSFCVLFFLSSILWLGHLKEVASLPTYHDGISHSMFFMKLVEYGSALISNAFLSFPDQFGEEKFHFYPTGSHALVVLFNGLFVKLGVVSGGQILKSWLLLVTSSVPLLAWWAAKQLTPSKSAIFSFAVGALYVTPFVFPVWATDSGGFSRLLAHLVAITIVVGILSSREKYLDAKVRRTLLVCLPLIFFFMHPTMFGLFAFSVVAWLIGTWFEYRKTTPMKTWAIDSICLFIGLGLIVGFFFLTNDFSQATSSDRLAKAPFTWQNVIGRAKSIVAFGFKTRYSSVLPLGNGFGLMQVLMIVGLVATLVPRKFFPVSWQVKCYPWLIFLSALVMSMVYFSPIKTLAKLNMIFLNSWERHGEILFTASLTLGLLGASFIVESFKVVKAKNLNLGRILAKPILRFVNLGGVLVIVIVFTTLLEARINVMASKRHLRRFFSVYQTPMRTQTEPLAQYIKSHTPEDSVLLFSPYVADSLFVRTGRKTLFIYEECPGNPRSVNCKKRLSWWDGVVKELKQVAAKPDPNQSCLGSTYIFDRPVIIITKPNETAQKKMKDSPKEICSNLSIVAQKGEYLVWQLASSKG